MKNPEKNSEVKNKNSEFKKTPEVKPLKEAELKKISGGGITRRSNVPLIN